MADYQNITGNVIYEIHFEIRLNHSSSKLPIDR